MILPNKESSSKTNLYFIFKCQQLPVKLSLLINSNDTGKSKRIGITKTLTNSKGINLKININKKCTHFIEN